MKIDEAIEYSLQLLQSKMSVATKKTITSLFPLFCYTVVM